MRAFTCFVCITAGMASAGLKTLPLAAGDCRNAELLTGMASFETALKGPLGADWFSGDVALDVVRPKASRSLEDLQRQVESARTLFYSGQLDKCLDLIHQSQTELDRVSPLTKPWSARVDAAMLEALVLKSQSKKAEFSEAIRKVLRLEPNYAADANLYTPGFLQEVDKLRKENQRAKKFRLELRSTSPAEVFLDGRLMGKTPYKADLLPATYRVTLVSQEAQSFARIVDLRKDETMNVDMAFEGAVSNQTPLCLNLSNEKEQVTAALKLASSIGVEQVVLFRLTSLPQDPAYFRATLLSRGVDVRSGGIQAKAKVGGNPLKDLATYVLTGEPVKSVETGTTLAKRADGTGRTPDVKAESPAIVKPPTTEPKKDSEVKSGVPTKTETAATPSAAQPLVASAPMTPAAPQGGGSSAGRIVSFILMGAGAVVIGGAVVNHLGGAADRNTLEQYLDPAKKTLPDTESPNFANAVIYSDKAKASRVTTAVLAAGGAALLLSGALTFFLFPPETSTEVAFVPNSQGGTLVLGGRF